MTDASLHKNLTERQEQLLASLIRAYITHPEPVSSKTLTLTTERNLSSATIRNEMAVLEEKGYIRSPHTSAGRIPTEDGYRYFVQYLLNNPSLPLPEVESIQSQLRDTPLEMESWLQTATLILAKQTRSAALVTEPRVWAEQRFKHIELISTHGRLILMVLVLSTGSVHQQMLVMSEAIPQPVLTQASDLLNRVCIDQPVQGVRDRSRGLSSILAQEIGELAADALQQVSELSSKILYRAGLSNVLPEFQGEEGVRQALQVLEGQVGLDEILSEMADKQIGGVQVIVGGEGRWEQFSNLSLVLGRYGTSRLMGAIGVIGPTRLHYDNAISTVSYIAGQVSEFLYDLHGEGREEENGESSPDIEESETGDVPE
ncbi:MAG: heat-inducible transcriptional repressor HrcA [Anaerolineae bacterium]|nr:heat-inducible transcriptional repressor HrcA [Anaerolineae bacterium]